MSDEPKREASPVNEPREAPVVDETVSQPEESAAAIASMMGTATSSSSNLSETAVDNVEPPEKVPSGEELIEKEPVVPSTSEPEQPAIGKQQSSDLTEPDADNQEPQAAGVWSETPERPHSRGPGARLAETFMERMRSRADPDALVAPPAISPQPSSERIARLDRQDEAFIMNTGLARKRVRVVQLLIIGLMSLLLGWLGNFFVGTSCHFTSVQVAVGQNGDLFDLHFGLWKYSPPDSAMAGYSYCYPYSTRHASDAPVVPRLANLLALLTGTYAQVILWGYLITGRARPGFWRWAVYSATTAGILQLSTLFFFVGALCRSNSCSIGPAAILAIVTAAAWFVFAFEMLYNEPRGDSATLKTADCESVSMASLEMADLEGASKEYLERWHTPRGTYQPPKLA